MTTSSVAPLPTAHYRSSQDERTIGTVLQATLAELEHRGYAAASLRTIAARAGVPLEMVFARWRSKQHLVHDAVEHLARAQPRPDTGHLHTDIDIVIGALVDLLAHPGTLDVLRPMLASAGAGDAAGVALRIGVLGERRAAVKRIVERGQRRQQVPASVHPGVVADAVIGAILYRLLISGEPLTRRTTGQLVDVVLATTRQAGPPSPR